MASLLAKIFGDPNEREVKKLWKIVEKVNELEPQIASLDNSALKAKTSEFKERMNLGATEDDLLPEAFAVVREAAKRKTGMRPFDVQILGGIVLHQGRIAEMKTGEGKTLVATMPAYLNALSGKGFHIVTVNDYLARRDSEWMGTIYRFLGLKVGLIVHGMDAPERKAAYQADITYGTNNEFGFDYLRDNMVLYKERLVQRPLNWAIVDEVDSILIDEARTPLIISGNLEKDTGIFNRWKSTIEFIIKRQDRLIKDLLHESIEKNRKGKYDEAAELLYLAKLGAPKNSRLFELLKETGVSKRVEKVKHYFSNKDREDLKEKLYFIIEEGTGLVYKTNRTVNILIKEEPELKHHPSYFSSFQEINKKKDELSEFDVDEESFTEEQKKIRQKAVDHDAIVDIMLKAYSLFERDKDYVVQNGEVIIVDEFTGRLMHGRRYSEDLHQAIEAKEGVDIKGRTRTIASITFQNYFRMYKKLAGMTGTALTEEEEFRKIYGMDVVVIPTNKPLHREELPDAVYRLEQAKFKAVIAEVEQCYQKKQPILVGTISIEKSEELSRMLKRRGIPHHVLNAKNHEKEAEIVAQAGRSGAVTIATNMAGRGTDIILGGNPEPKIDELHNDPNLKEEVKQEKIAQIRETWEKHHDEVVRLGGLHILGTERHESRRIDNQLRGRAGRQGDPGSSQFFVSLEDDLMRLFGSDNIRPVLERIGMEEDLPINHPLISRAIENAQKRVEGRNFEIRKHVLEYDDVLNQQREIIYSQRRRVLEGDNLKEKILEMINDVIEKALDLYTNERTLPEDWDLESLLTYAEKIFLPKTQIKIADIKELGREEIKNKLNEVARQQYEGREGELGLDVMRELERVVLLRTVDSKWMDHIDAMHKLRQGIGLRVYGQRDPLVEYKYEAYEMFREMIHSIQEDVVKLIYHVQVTTKPHRQSVVKASSDKGNNVNDSIPNKVANRKIGRNDPCPCGSGKKYKRCCGKN